MFLIEHNVTFQSQHQPDTTPHLNDYLFVFQNGKIGLTHTNDLPRYTPQLAKPYPTYRFGSLQGQGCLLWPHPMDIPLTFLETKTAIKTLTDPLQFQAIAFANHLVHWRESHRFCGKCAQPLIDMQAERARACLSCHHTVYPKISPCVIVLITRGNEILLARSPHFVPGMMSALAGFIEVGESVEQTLKREVYEEVGIEITDIQYIGSQPWPFPDALMLGFHARYLSGEIQIDGQEIEAAQWFHRDELPEKLPSELSISRLLIETFLKQKRA